MNSQNRPTRWAGKWLQLFIKPEHLEEITGDLEEVYNDLLCDHPILKANLLYIRECLIVLRPVLVKRLSGSMTRLNYYGMFRLFVKTTIRNLIKYRAISMASLASLVIGAMFFQFINAWVWNEKEMDIFHKNINKIHVSTIQTSPNADLNPISHQLFFQLDHHRFPEIEKTLMIHVYRPDEIRFITNDHEHQGKALVVDSTFFDFFDFEISSGDTSDALSSPSHILVTAQFATRVFGDADPIGQKVEIKCDQKGLYQIAGVLKDPPANSSIDFDFLIPRHSSNFWRRIPQEMILVNEKFDQASFHQKIANLGQTNQRFSESILSTVPLKSIYWNRPFDISLFAKYGDYKNLLMMQGISWLVIIITTLSFMNLQTTQQLSSTRKIGLKQLSGANKLNLIYEMAINGAVYFIIAVVLAFVAYQSLFPYVAQYMRMDLEQIPGRDLYGIGSVILVAVGLSLLFFIRRLISIKPMDAIGGNYNFLKIPRFQKALTTIQYGLTVVLLLGAMVVYYQFNFMINSNIGINQTNIISVDFFEMMTGFNGSNERLAMEKKHQLVKNELSSNPNVSVFSQGTMPVSTVVSSSWKKVGAIDQYTSVNKIYADPAYKDLFGLKVVEGRFFDEKLDHSHELKVVINEAARDYFDFQQISGRQLMSNTSGRDEFKFDVIGVVEDFHYEHLSHAIKPLIIQYRINGDEPFIIGINSESVATIESLEKLYRKVNPKAIFSYESLENVLSRQYEKEKQTGRLYLSFAVVALILSCIGLFALAFHETNRRTKEIGIRKVNGAGLTDILQMLGISFFRILMVSFIFGSIIGWYLMNNWLQNFANRTEMSWWYFGIAGLIIMVCSSFAILWQSFKVAKINPVETLRYE